MIPVVVRSEVAVAWRNSVMRMGSGVAMRDRRGHV